MDDETAALAVHLRGDFRMGLRDCRRRARAGGACGVDVHARSLCTDCFATHKIAEWNRWCDAGVARLVAQRSFPSRFSTHFSVRAPDFAARSALAAPDER